MNHYPHHIGDFNNATRHLTRVERSLYRDLLDLYYDTEKALPGDDVDRLARRVLAVNDEEKAAMVAVLAEFFTLTDGEYHHGRCDKEIARYQGLKASASKAGKASAEKRINAKATPVERSLKSRSTNQNQNQNQDKPLSGKPDVPVGFAKFWAAWPATARKVAKAECLAKWHRRCYEPRADAIVAHVEAMKATKQWQDGFEPAPLTYLGQRRHEDEVFAGAPKQSAFAGAE